MEAVDQGKYILGGGFIRLDQPDWECRGCRHQWFDAEDPARIRRDQLLNDFINDSPDEETDQKSTSV
jgi:hypothetical protein